MKRQTLLLGLDDDDASFRYINDTFRHKITTFDWFVNWRKVIENTASIEKELNILNYLIGKQDIRKETSAIILQYPEVIKAFPYLIASREKSFEVLVNVKKLISKRFDFSVTKPTKEQADTLSDFLIEVGFSEILKDRKIKNLVDYSIGVEVGLDTNGRKNRSGTMMEGIVEVIIDDFCTNSSAQYLAQATALKIKEIWNIDVKMDKSSRIIDFAINNNGKLYLVEVNFYSGGGSKLKSTATEYCEMYERYHKQGLEFIWVTDGAGWLSTQKPLREYFDKGDYLVNLDMLCNGILTKIIE
ncbi:MAG: type II restriction endonuclease [Muribaculaceae bacterium]